MGRIAEERELALHPRSPQTSRQQWIYEGLRDAILRGQLKPKVRLPASRDLARQYQIARGTVVSAYEQLTIEGYLVCTVGRGTFVAPELPDKLLRASPNPVPAAHKAQRPALSQRGILLSKSPFLLTHTVEPVRAFRVALPDVQAFPINIWKGILSKQASRNRTLLLDADAGGYRPLREAIATYIAASRGVTTSADNVIIVSSVQQSLDLIIRLLLNPDDAAWVEDPGYPGGRAVIAAAGARVVGVPVDSQGLNVDAGKKLASNARFAYVTPGRHGPLGMPLSLSRRLELLSWAKKANAYIFEDDYDSEYRFNGKPIAALKSLDGEGRVIYAGTFSKLMFPSIRLAYIVLPSSLTESFISALSLIEKCAGRNTSRAARFYRRGSFLAAHPANAAALCGTCSSTTVCCGNILGWPA